jgi:hypothetical protein
VHLTPFVNDLSIAPDALEGLLDAVLAALLPSAQPGVLKLSSKLTIQHFVLLLDLNGTINELRIPIYGDLSVSSAFLKKYLDILLYLCRVFKAKVNAY